MGTINVSVVQLSMGDDARDNVARAGELVARAAADGADVVLLPELFAGPYFPRDPGRDASHLAHAVDAAPEVQAMRELARRHGVVLPVSFFERDGDAFYNSLAMIDADGALLGVYRKSHIPGGPGYEEKRFFRPGDTGFVVFDTRAGRLGAGICWDQWFPECARALTLLGAELLLYPTAIGSEPTRPEVDTRDPWRRVMIGHAVANTIPVAAANRVGDEGGQVFYGSSFVCDHRGERVAELDRSQTGVATARFDREELARERDWFGLLGDRRPDLYAKLVE